MWWLDFLTGKRWRSLSHVRLFASLDFLKYHNIKSSDIKQCMCLWGKKKNNNTKPKVLQNHTLKTGNKTLKPVQLWHSVYIYVFWSFPVFHRHYLLQGWQQSKEVNRTDVSHDVSEKSAGSQKGPVAFPGKHSNTCGNTKANTWFFVLCIYWHTLLARLITPLELMVS